MSQGIQPLGTFNFQGLAMNKKTHNKIRTHILVVLIFTGLLLSNPSLISTSLAQFSSNTYLPMILTKGSPNSDQGARVNAPYFDGGIPWEQTAIAWFGNVTPTDNYTDIRIGYNDNEILIQLEIFDRRLWYDTTPSLADLTNWDAITLYINTEGNHVTNLDEYSYKFIAQLNWWEDRGDFQAVYRGGSSGWQPTSLQFEAKTGWRGDAPNNDNDDRGWVVSFYIPFTELGLQSKPNDGYIWGAAIELHDRDDQQGTPISTKTWPPILNANQPNTWNQIHFGLSVWTPPQATNLQSVSIRHNLNGAFVEDAHVGGHTVCGQDYSPDFFDGWGDANYSGYDQINIQNQADVADWPCFSKFYITFPLADIPQGKIITSAEFVFYQFGNSDPSQAQHSLIQVLTINQDWDEDTLTWNNAPLAQENISQAWVDPVVTFPGWPGVEWRWNISPAVAQAYQAKQPLRLALYDADTAYHSGKYFISSDTGEWNATGRPTLIVTYGDP
jgi:hypothetical protein